ncbi:cytochrome Cbb3 [Endozoicomonas montiporae]|uniref:Cbb3-type cytochrome c oxidase subunit n=2 Tax=Endozoicomonas montiporae TaxID=1027273 RepID=A0A081N5S5_9GAMM|nr:cytochrome-c oxidase, cbb3-type subunit III [Endozoicomonas montiporae]KEQ13798.1 cytochrome Cbb3 [Endozoicomonas montiporae]
MSSFWSGWIIVLTLACLVLVIWLLFATRKTQRRDLTDETTGHSYDGIEELDNPMPHWWFLLFVATLVFSAAYLLLYPGMGNWKGFLGWTSVGELERSEEKHDRRYAPLFSQYARTPIEKLVENPKALKMGQRIFLNNCALCHGSDAGGAFGFPNLTDNEWLYGGSPEEIKTTIMDGRKGQMPAWGAVIGEKGVRDVSTFVRYQVGLIDQVDDDVISNGKKIYADTCSICHGPNGEGNKALGAPNLTDAVWLYGSSQAEIEYTVRSGRNGVMPAWKDILGEEKVHLVSTYVYSLEDKKK